MKRPSAKDEKCASAKVKKRPAAKVEQHPTPKFKKHPSTADVKTLHASAKSKLLGEREDYAGPMQLEDCLALMALQTLEAKQK